MTTNALSATTGSFSSTLTANTLSSQKHYFAGNASAGATNIFELDVTGAATDSTNLIRMFRNMNSTVSSQFVIAKGDGSSTANHILSSNSNSYLCSVAGNLGIGVTTPLAKLHVVQTGTADCLRIDDQASDSTRFTIDQSGQLGIKTAVGYKCPYYHQCRKSSRC